MEILYVQSIGMDLLETRDLETIHLDIGFPTDLMPNDKLLSVSFRI